MASLQPSAPASEAQSFCPKCPFWRDEDSPAWSLRSPQGPRKQFSLSGCCVPPPELLAGKLAKQPGADLDSWRRGDAMVYAFICTSALERF